MTSRDLEALLDSPAPVMDSRIIALATELLECRKVLGGERLACALYRQNPGSAAAAESWFAERHRVEALAARIAKEDAQGGEG